MHFLITVGGTREYIDPVRFVSNASSGKTGHALACASLEAGHKVTVITTPTVQHPPNGAKIVKVETADQMFKAVKKHFPQCDCLIMAAAVADYTVVRPAKIKIEKTQKNMTIKLKQTIDILKWAGKHKKKNQKVIGFALDDKAIRTRADRKLKEKNLDMIIANTPAAIGSDKSTVQIKVPGHKWQKFPQAGKIAIARKIITMGENLGAIASPK